MMVMLLLFLLLLLPILRFLTYNTHTHTQWKGNVVVVYSMFLLFDEDVIDGVETGIASKSFLLEWPNSKEAVLYVMIVDVDDDDDD